MRRGVRLALIAAVVAVVAASAIVVGRPLLEQMIEGRTRLVSGGSLPNWISDAVAVPLDDGRVLIAGGELRAVAQIFDPATHQTTLIDDGGAARTVQWAVRLPDGRVVLLSVDATADFIDSRSRLWVVDPRTNSSTPPIETREQRFGSAGAVLPDGRVLISGGVRDPESTDPPLASTEILDPTLGTLTDGPSMSKGRSGHVTAVLADGSILIVGGAPVSALVEVLDPGTASTRTIGVLGRGSAGVDVLPLPDGRAVLIDRGSEGMHCGWHGISPIAAYLVDPATQSVSRIKDIPHRVDTASVLRDGRIIVTGHWQAIPGGCGGGDYLVDAWIGVYDPITGVTLETLNPMTGQRGLPIDTDLPYIASVATKDGRVLLVGDTQTADGQLQTNPVDILTVAPR